MSLGNKEHAQSKWGYNVPEGKKLISARDRGASDLVSMLLEETCNYPDSQRPSQFKRQCLHIGDYGHTTHTRQ